MGLENFLDQTCNIRTLATRQGASGAPERTLQPVLYVGIPCLIRELGGSTEVKDGKATMLSNVRLYFDPSDIDPDFRLTSRHLIEVLTPVGARYYSPTGVADVNSLGRLLQVDATEQVV